MWWLAIRSWASMKNREVALGAPRGLSPVEMPSGRTRRRRLDRSGTHRAAPTRTRPAKVAGGGQRVGKRRGTHPGTPSRPPAPPTVSPGRSVGVPHPGPPTVRDATGSIRLPRTRPWRRRSSMPTARTPRQGRTDRDSAAGLRPGRLIGRPRREPGSGCCRVSRRAWGSTGRSCCAARRGPSTLAAFRAGGTARRPPRPLTTSVGGWRVPRHRRTARWCSTPGRSRFA